MGAWHSAERKGDLMSRFRERYGSAKAIAFMHNNCLNKLKIEYLWVRGAVGSAEDS